MQDLYYVIFSDTSRNNGGLKPKCRQMSRSDIFNSASVELNRQGLSFEDMAGIPFIEDESGDFLPERELTEKEQFNLAIAKLGDDGRLFDVYENQDEFLLSAVGFEIYRQAQNLIFS